MGGYNALVKHISSFTRILLDYEPDQLKAIYASVSLLFLSFSNQVSHLVFPSFVTAATVLVGMTRRRFARLSLTGSMRGALILAWSMIIVTTAASPTPIVVDFFALPSSTGMILSTSSPRSLFA